MTYGTVQANAIQGSINTFSPNSAVFRNRIINGAMTIDQRNAGASVTITNTLAATYTLDRWAAYGSNASRISVQQNAGSVTPPTGFTNYLGITSLSAYSVTSSDIFVLLQNIEGFNIADLGWGTANAQAVTLSFWVRSSLTGTFGGVLRNSADTRSYPFTYTISAANTWEQKSITIAGDTSGTWLTNNGVGIRVVWGLGVGSTNSGTAGSWSSASFQSATGATSVVATNGATFYITGVQLEVGTTATSFEYRPYGTELQLCQRYYQQITRNEAYVGTGQATTTANVRGPSISLMQTMRTAPTITLPSVGGTSGTISYLTSNDGYPGTFGTISTFNITTQWFSLNGSGFTSAFTAGNASNLYFSGSSTITISAEL